MTKREIYQLYRFVELDYKTTDCRLDFLTIDGYGGSISHLIEELNRLANKYNNYKRGRRK